jgi:ribosomal protein S18 acetylase RimI-like enzyme
MGGDPQAQGAFSLRPPKPNDSVLALSLYLDGARQHLAKIGRWNRKLTVARFRSGYNPAQVKIICVGEEAVGWVQVIEFAGRLQLRQLHLIPGHRGNGIGTSLITGVLKRADASGKPVTLDVLHGNPARSLYLRLGFKQTGQDADRIQMIRRPIRG